ncbi:hypothetical protein [Chromobacterium violaceum]|uniref:hypothetical protein n=1 Tax=Chromobacterium violaceum TaxID=536 RepID=UPI0011C0696C|nr:hypothetical protein [Chromobacterium violaceum]
MAFIEMNLIVITMEIKNPTSKLINLYNTACQNKAGSNVNAMSNKDLNPGTKKVCLKSIGNIFFLKIYKPKQVEIVAEISIDAPYNIAQKNQMPSIRKRT